MIRRLIDTVVLSAAEAAFQPGGPIPHSYKDIGYDAFLTRILASSMDLVLGATVACFFVQWIAPFVLMGRARRFSRMNLDDRTALLERMRNNRLYAIRGMFMILNTLIVMPFFSSESVTEYLGYFNHRHGLNKADGHIPPEVRPQVVHAG